MSLPQVNLWCDGSGTTAREPAGWAYILIYGTVEREHCGGLVAGTNNRAELMACIKGFEALKKSCSVVVHCDSEYVCKAYPHGWIDNWKRKRWVGVKNADLWQRLERAVAPHEVTWKWVPGHSKIVLNERCDAMAGSCRRAIKERLAEDQPLSGLTFEIEDYEPSEQLSLIGGGKSNLFDCND